MTVLSFSALHKPFQAFKKVKGERDVNKKRNQKKTPQKRHDKMFDSVLLSGWAGAVASQKTKNKKKQSQLYKNELMWWWRK